MTESTLRASPESEAVVRARGLVVRTLRQWSLADQEEPVMAIVAELVANAVRHAGTPLEVRLVRKPYGVRVEVHDRAGRLPRLSVPRFEEEEHRGLLIVDHYASAWGADLLPGGKVVWAEVREPAVNTGRRAVTESGGDTSRRP
jgi:anti-sigma regulatory factor (Ser/Thr protein kinase)